MERIDRIIHNREYQQHLMKNETAEENRLFCRHNLAHYLDVARIAYILVLEAGAEIPKDVVYATALLHDIGRHEQYETGIGHEIASARIAEEILAECGYGGEELEGMLQAIVHHREPPMLSDLSIDSSLEASPYRLFCALFYRADKASRACYHCAAEPMCDWDQEKKNPTITI